MKATAYDADPSRRRLLKGALALPLLPLLQSWPVRAAGGKGFRRVRPGEPEWRSAASCRGN